MHGLTLRMQAPTGSPSPPRPGGDWCLWSVHPLQLCPCEPGGGGSRRTDPEVAQFSQASSLPTLTCLLCRSKFHCTGKRGRNAQLSSPRVLQATPGHSTTIPVHPEDPMQTQPSCGPTNIRERRQDLSCQITHMPDRSLPTPSHTSFSEL